MSNANLKVHSYENLLKSLIQLLQNQILAMARIHGLDKNWSLQFTSLVSHLQSIEVEEPRTPNFSLAFKDLFNYLNRNLSSQQSSRSRATTLESSLKKRTKSINNHSTFASILVPSNQTGKKSVTSTYYSKIMNNFLTTQHKTPKFTLKSGLKFEPKKKKNEDQDLWVLGDEIKFLV